MPGEWSNRQPFSNPCSEKWLYRGAVINGACLPLVLKVVCIFTFPNCRESLAINGQREVRAIFYRFYENTKPRVKDQRASPLPNTQRFTWPCRSSCNVRFHCQKGRWEKKKNKYKRRRANNLNLHTRVRIVRIITWNSGADKKKSPVFKWSVTAAAQALDRLCSFSRQQGSQERYQSARPPCEMSSLSRGLWDCCHHPNSLWMSASLTGQLDDAAPHHRQQTHFQLSSFIPSYFFLFLLTLAQRRSVAEQMTRETHQRQFTLNLFDKFSPLEKLI